MDEKNGGTDKVIRVEFDLPQWLVSAMMEGMCLKDIVEIEDFQVVSMVLRAGLLANWISTMSKGINSAKMTLAASKLLGTGIELVRIGDDPKVATLEQRISKMMLVVEKASCYFESDVIPGLEPEIAEIFKS